jgi:hypothetical protein
MFCRLGHGVRTTGSLALVLLLVGCYNGPGTDMAAGPAASVPQIRASGAPFNVRGLGAPRYQFADHYEQGTINSEATAATPNHRGVLVLPMAINGTAVPTLTVLGTYRYAYHVSIEHGDVLAFEAAKGANIGIAAFAFVDVTDGRATRRVFGADLQPADADGPHWHAFRASLDRYAGRAVTITFGADIVDGNGIATWASFAHAAIYAAAKRPRSK